PGHISSEYPTTETRPVCPPSGSALAAPAAVDRCSVSTPFAVDPTAHRAAQRILPDFAHPLRHCPGWPALAPKRSPDSSADTPCPLTSGPSLLPPGSAIRPVSSHDDVRVFRSRNCSSSPSLLFWLPALARLSSSAAFPGPHSGRRSLGHGTFVPLQAPRSGPTTDRASLTTSLLLIGSLTPVPPGDSASSPEVTYCSSPPCRPQSP